LAIDCQLLCFESPQFPRWLLVLLQLLLLLQVLLVILSWCRKLEIRRKVVFEVASPLPTPDPAVELYFRVYSWSALLCLMMARLPQLPRNVEAAQPMLLTYYQSLSGNDLL
jgi:hypothetical protein